MTKDLVQSLTGGALVFLAAMPLARADAIDRALPAPLTDEAGQGGSETAVLAGGCFWGMQAVFEHVKGVTKVVAGYAGGDKRTATYDQVSAETTGHAESVAISFDPKAVSFGTLLRDYFSIAHDPTELNRQGPDEGSSYRSEIFATSPAQARVAGAYISQLARSRAFSAPLVTRVSALKGFYPAESYHQDFLIRNPTYPYIVINDLPKIAALKRVFPSLYRDMPARLAIASP
ncbi:MAG: peptide-methionine (S)-S-oxide reductase MsrA [Alphaproteobacteria bacterium]|nr:peptide-methionine (S)-S-oxide reductase MsrA [Alphaproteobacteria bacterium]